MGMDVAHCTLDGNADAVEFCPHSSFSNVLAASTYRLQEGDQPSRSGNLSIFNVNADIGSLELIHRVETAGIFDIKWSPVGQTASPLLAQAYADGCVRIHALQCSSNGAEGECLKDRYGSNISSSLSLPGYIHLSGAFRWFHLNTLRRRVSYGSAEPVESSRI